MSRDRMEARFRAGVGADLDLLAALHDREMDGQTLRTLRAMGFPAGLSLELHSPGSAIAMASMEAVLASFAGLDEAELLEELAAAYADVYLIHGVGASPTESPWMDKDGLERQQPMHDSKAWYARHGLRILDWAVRPEDHLVHQLQFLTHLIRQGRGDESLDEAARFLAAHPLGWVPRFADRLAQGGGPHFYVALAELTAVYLDELHGLLRMLVPPMPVVSARPAACSACPS